MKLVRNKNILRQQASKATADRADRRQSSIDLTNTITIDEAELRELKERLAVAESDLASTTTKLLAIQRQNDELVLKIHKMEGSKEGLVQTLRESNRNAKDLFQSLRNENALLTAQTAADIQIREAEWVEKYDTLRKHLEGIFLAKLKRERTKRRIGSYPGGTRNHESNVQGGVTPEAMSGFKHSCRTKFRNAHELRGTAARSMRKERGGSMGTTITLTATDMFTRTDGEGKENVYGLHAREESMAFEESQNLSDAEVY